jgi:hypothetical protein
MYHKTLLCITKYFYILDSDSNSTTKTHKINCGVSTAKWLFERARMLHYACISYLVKNMIPWKTLKNNLTSLQGGKVASILQFIDVPIVDHHTCSGQQKRAVLGGEICAGYSTGGKDACQVKWFCYNLDLLHKSQCIQITYFLKSYLTGYQTSSTGIRFTDVSKVH